MMDLRPEVLAALQRDARHAGEDAALLLEYVAAELRAALDALPPGNPHGDAQHASACVLRAWTTVGQIVRAQRDYTAAHLVA